jgi:hypothetical protein
MCELWLRQRLSYVLVMVMVLRITITVSPNLWYAYPCWYAADRLGVGENNIGNGG